MPDSTAITVKPLRLTVGQLLLAHFWKLFVVATLAVVAWFVYELREFRGAAAPMRVSISEASTVYSNPAPWWLSDSYLHYSTEEQSRPATVMLKDNNGTLSGFLVSVNDDFAYLATSLPDRGETESILIARNAIQCIKVTTKRKPDNNKR